MSLQMQWVGEPDRDRVAETRAKCYGPASGELPRFVEGIRSDGRAVDGDFLLAELDGRTVGTATALSMSMWMRGAKVPCQGVAWVGTIKTHRRGAGAAERGVASQIMHETLRAARERQQVVSALMPFRASFYDHFGYGIVERRAAWTVPLAILPTGGFEDVRFLESADHPALAECRQRHVERGQCDIERSAASWAIHLKKWEEGWVAIDRAGDEPIRGYAAFHNVHKDGRDIVTVSECGFDDDNALRRLLHFLASLRDQYSAATLMLPTDLPLNRMLRETQLPHRLVNHPHAEVKPFTRMQIRVLDHRRLIEAMQFRADASGKVVVAVKECEGHESRFAIEVNDGKASVATSAATPDFECTDGIWAAIVSGDLPAGEAVRMGLATATPSDALSPLEAFSRGAVPFCQEYF